MSNLSSKIYFFLILDSLINSLTAILPNSNTTGLCLRAEEENNINQDRKFYVFDFWQYLTMLIYNFRYFVYRG